MTVYADHLSTEAQQFNWLLSQFAGNTPEVIDAIAVSSDGLLIAVSNRLDRANADRLAAITSAIISLAQGAGRVYDLGAPEQGHHRPGRRLPAGQRDQRRLDPGRARHPAANLGNLAYEMAVFANRAGEVITPQLIEELKASVGLLTRLKALGARSLVGRGGTGRCRRRCAPARAAGDRPRRPAAWPGSGRTAWRPAGAGPGPARPGVGTVAATRLTTTMLAFWASPTRSSTKRSIVRPASSPTGRNIAVSQTPSGAW